MQLLSLFTRLPISCLMLALLVGAGAQQPLASPPPFRPGEIWLDTSGVPINAHGGGFIFRNGTYYWYGEFKTAGPGGNLANVGVSVYSSTNLYHWKNEGIALKVSEDPASDITKGCILERPKVLFNAKTGLYVMWFHVELKGKGYNAARAGVATSPSPTGPFTFLRDFRPDGEMSRDMTLYQDNDGKAYLITTSENNQTQHLSQLTDDYLDTTGHYTRIFAHKALEGAAIFKANGHYFYIGSHTTGWDPNPAFGAVAETLAGPWRELGNPARGENAELTFASQSTYFLPVQGKPGAFIFVADRWRPKNAIDGRYVWLPVTVSGDSFTVEWRSSWDMSAFSTPEAIPRPSPGRPWEECALANSGVRAPVTPAKSNDRLTCKNYLQVRQLTSLILPLYYLLEISNNFVPLFLNTCTSQQQFRLRRPGRNLSFFL